MNKCVAGNFPDGSLGEGTIIFASVLLVPFNRAASSKLYRISPLSAAQILMSSSIPDLFFYMMVFRSGFSKLDKKNVKPERPVKFSDVSGSMKPRTNVEVSSSSRPRASEKIAAGSCEDLMMGLRVGRVSSKAIATEPGCRSYQCGQQFNEIFVGSARPCAPAF